MTTTKTLLALRPVRALACICLALAGILTVGAGSALAAAPEAPLLELQSLATPAASSEASFHVVINPAGTGEPGATFELLYAKGASCEGEGKASAGIATGAPEEFTATLTGLAPNTQYTACMVLTNAAKEKASSPLVPFLTPPGAETKPATEVSTSSAKLEGTLQTEGGEVEYWFSYDAGPNCTGPSAKLAPESPATGKGTVSGPVSKLLPGTQYSYCLIARNAGGETVGNQQSFTTKPVAPAITEEPSAVNVSGEAARLLAQADPGGADTRYRFEYDTTPYPPGSPGHGQSVTGDAGEGAVPVSLEAHLQGLAPRTAYHYRIVIESAVGKELGEDHTFTTQSTSTSAGLPDNRAWELVSPPNKHGGLIESLAGNEAGALIQASADGSAFTYVANAPVEQQPAGNRSPNVVQLYSTRSAAGWSTQEIATPHETIAVLSAGEPSEYKFFSEDLSAGIVEPLGATPLSSLTSERTPYRAQPGAGECPRRPAIVPPNICYQPLVTAANVPPGTKFGGTEEGIINPGAYRNGVEFETATPDLNHVVLHSPQVLAGGFTPGFSSEATNLYELSGASGDRLGSLQTVSLIPPPGAGQCGGAGPACVPAAEAGLTAAVGHGGHDMRGAIFERREPHRLQSRKRSVCA